MDAIVTAPKIDEQRLADLALKAAADSAAATTVLLAHIGDQTGVYRAMAAIGRSLPAAIARAAKVDERYLIEWLSNQAAAGYVTYHAEDGTFSLSPEQEIVMASDGHPACALGLFQLPVAEAATYETAIEVFRTGKGRSWSEQHSCIFCGVDRFYRGGYATNLVSTWLPALGGVVERLTAGAKVGDVGCGHGSSTVLMAEAFPASRFVGIDFHEASIAEARRQAAEAGVTNAAFQVAGAGDYAEGGFDLVCMFDALHDMGDPARIARHVLQSLKPDGVLMLVEPMAGDRLEDNLHLVGQMYYGGSTLICTPTAKAQGGVALGAQAGPKRLTEVLNEAGFSRVRLAHATETNMVLEARR